MGGTDYWLPRSRPGYSLFRNALMYECIDICSEKGEQVLMNARVVRIASHSYLCTCSICNTMFLFLATLGV